MTTRHAEWLNFQNSTVGIMTRLQAEFQRYLVEFLAGARDFPFFIEFRLAMGNSHPVKGAHFPQVKRPGYKDDHLPPFGAEVQNKWSCTSTVTYIDKACSRNSTSQLIFGCHCILKINPHSNRYISWESYNIRTFSYGIIIITMRCPSDWQCRRG